MEQPQPYQVYGHPVKCSHCGNDAFYTYQTVLESRTEAFLNIAWLNEPTDNFICSRCGHIESFYPMEPQ